MVSPHNLQKSGEISILQVKSCDNLADLSTKSLPNSTFQKCVHGIGMRRLRDLQVSGGVSSWDILILMTSHYAIFLCEYMFQDLIKDFMKNFWRRIFWDDRASRTIVKMIYMVKHRLGRVLKNNSVIRGKSLLAQTVVAVCPATDVSLRSPGTDASSRDRRVSSGDIKGDM